MRNQNSSKISDATGDSDLETMLELSGTLLTTPSPDYAKFVRNYNNNTELVDAGLLPDLRIF